MENPREHDLQDPQIQELTQARLLAQQLALQLAHEDSSVDQSSKQLAEGVVASIDKALTVAKSYSTTKQSSDYHSTLQSEVMPTSSIGYKDSETSMDLDASKAPTRSWKSSRLSQTLTVPGIRSGTILLPADDGYSWRKYGQKDTLGSIYPRSYYRCTHHNTKGCRAMKQVQRSEDSPEAFVVTYTGEHTCGSNPAPLLPLFSSHSQGTSEESAILGGDDERGVGNWNMPSLGGDDERGVGNWKTPWLLGGDDERGVGNWNLQQLHDIEMEDPKPSSTSNAANRLNVLLNVILFIIRLTRKVGRRMPSPEAPTILRNEQALKPIHLGFAEVERDSGSEVD